MEDEHARPSVMILSALIVILLIQGFALADALLAIIKTSSQDFAKVSLT